MTIIYKEYVSFKNAITAHFIPRCLALRGVRTITFYARRSWRNRYCTVLENRSICDRGPENLNTVNKKNAGRKSRDTLPLINLFTINEEATFFTRSGGQQRARSLHPLVR